MRGSAKAESAVPSRRYRGDDAEARRRERRRRLLEHGFALFGTQGYDATPIRSVCRRARVATRYFYESFASKEELLQAVLDDIVERARAAVVAALRDAPEDPRARLEAGLRAFAHAYLDDPRAIRVAFVETLGRGPAVEARRRHYVREFAAVIAQQADVFARQGRVELPTGPERVGLAMAGMVSELLIDWTTQRDQPSADELVDELMAIFDVVLRGAQPRRAASPTKPRRAPARRTPHRRTPP